jgi:hypothetical protein
VRDQLLCAIVAADLAEQRQLRDQIASDPRSRLWSAIRANCTLKPAKREPLEICLDVASKLDFSEPLAELVFVCPQKKNSEGYKAYCEFGLRHRTSQDIVLRIMEHYLVPHDFQHMEVPSAIEAAKFAIKTGCLYYAHLKISPFYESIEPEKLGPILPLSQGLTEHAVFGRHMNLKGKSLLHPSWIALLLQARRGLLYGSACSPIIGAFTLSRLWFSQGHPDFLVNLADDFLLFSESGDELLEAAIEELLEDIAKLPGGHFVPKIVAQGSVYEGINFLGHQLQFVNGTVKTTVSPAAVEATLSQWNELDRRINRKGFIIGRATPRAKKLLARMFSFAQGWRAEFKECDDVDEYYSSFIAQIEDYAKSLHVDLNEIIALVDESMKYRSDAYSSEKWPNAS